MSETRCSAVAKLLAAGLFCGSGAFAGSYTYATIDVPGADQTLAYGVNNGGEVVGVYIVGSTQYGFTELGGAFTMPPVAYAHGINDGGQIVGNYAGSGNSTGFVDTGGVFSTVSFPGADATFPTGINNSGQIVGYYIASGATHGFVYSGGVFTTVDNPNAVTSSGGGVRTYGESMIWARWSAITVHPPAR